MIHFDFLYRGLCGMANAPRANSMTGHLGAAILAGYFFGENHPDLAPGVVAAIERDLRRITGGEESLWFDPKKANITAAELFKPIPKAQPVDDAKQVIATALEQNIGKMRQSGHNVIFASLAIRALGEHGEFATAELVAGIGNLIRGFDTQHAGRGYYGKARGWLSGQAAPLADSESTPGYSTLEEMADAVITELVATAAEHRRGFGGLFHLINHAAALAELHHFGFGDLARRGLAGHRHHLLLYRALPNLESELGKLETTGESPFEPEYWKRTESEQWGAWLTHRIKTLFGFYTLLELVEDETTRRTAVEQFGYLLT